MRFPYSASLNPPAPFLPVRVSNLTGAGPTTVSAKIDTGADITAIPAYFVEQLDLAPAGELVVEGYDGQRATVLCYDIVLHVDRLRVVGLSVVAFAEDYALLGRDVLNRLRILLDGPELTTEILTP